MDTAKTIDTLTLKMFAFNEGDAKRIQHLMKVHRFAQLIARMEGLDTHTRFVVECAALVHDIGIRPAEAKYGSCTGKLQEQEGPAYARPMLEELGLDAAVSSQVSGGAPPHLHRHRRGGLPDSGGSGFSGEPV